MVWYCAPIVTSGQASSETRRLDPWGAPSRDDPPEEESGGGWLPRIFAKLGVYGTKRASSLPKGGRGGYPGSQKGC